MSYAKIAKVVDSLIVNTELEKIQWTESTFDKDAFQYSTANSSIVIRQFMTNYGEFSVFIDVYNKNGHKVESVSDDELSQFFESSCHKMSTLFSTARRQALGVEQVLDDLLEELPSVSESKSALKSTHSQMSGMDEVPF